jgi:hypothetical protein
MLCIGEKAKGREETYNTLEASGAIGERLYRGKHEVSFPYQPYPLCNVCNLAHCITGSRMA